MKEFLDILCACALFEGITQAEAETVLGCLDARTRTYAKGEAILCAGASVDAVGLLLSGGAHISQTDFWGNHNILSQIVPGQVFAEAFACADGAVLNVDVVAVAPSTALYLRVVRLLTTCHAACPFHGRLIRNLLRDAARKNIDLTRKLTHMAQRTTREKLMSYLSSESKKRRSAAFDIPFNRQQLADYLCIERSAMSSALCALRDAGVIAFQKNRFVLLDEKERCDS